MAKKKVGKHLKFYSGCFYSKKMPGVGLCSCAIMEYIDEDLLNLFYPDDSISTAFSFWASGHENKDCLYRFTPLRQTIVLFMAAMSGEL